MRSALLGHWRPEAKSRMRLDLHYNGIAPGGCVKWPVLAEV